MHYVSQRKTDSRHKVLLKAAEMTVQHSENIVNIIGDLNQDSRYRRLQYDGSAVHMAVEYGQNDILSLLLEHEANPDVTSKL